VPWNISLYGIYIIHSGILSNLHAHALKNRVCIHIFHCIEHILFTFRIFEQLTLALKNRGCPKLTVLNVFLLLLRIFEQLALALKNRGCPEIFRCIEYIFHYSVVLSNLRLP